MIRAISRMLLPWARSSCNFKTDPPLSILASHSFGILAEVEWSALFAQGWVKSFPALLGHSNPGAYSPQQTSPGNDANLRPVSGPSTVQSSGSLGFRRVVPAHTGCTTSHGVRVPQVLALLPASFRFRLATATLTLGSGWCCLARTGLTPPSQRPCQGHKERERSCQTPLSFLRRLNCYSAVSVIAS